MAKKQKRSRKASAESPVVIATSRKKTIGGIDKYEVTNATDTLMQAEDIKKDKKLMKAVQIDKGQRQNALSGIVREAETVKPPDVSEAEGYVRDRVKRRRKKGGL